MREYFDDVYVDPSLSRRIDARRHALFLDFLDGLRQAGRSRLLDVGCGTGQFIELARTRGWDARGVEVSPEAVTTARGRGLPVALRATDGDDGERLPFPDESFDVVALWNVIEFFQRPDADLREIARVLAAGGRIVIRTQNERFHLAAYRLHRCLSWLPATSLLGRSYVFHPILWSRPTLAAALARAGFVDVVVANSALTAGDPYGAADAAVQAGKWVLDRVARAVDRLSGGAWLIGSSLTAVARKPG